MPLSDSSSGCSTDTSDPCCLTVGELGAAIVAALLHRYGLDLRLLDHGQPITGSYWGEPEAGIVGGTVYARADTPVHSVLHETAHVVCMPPGRRASLDTDAGGDDLEEAAVCYLQLLLADAMPGVGRARLMADMDAWGYSFRMGTTRGWFENDADDARAFLLGHRLATAGGQPTWHKRHD